MDDMRLPDLTLPTSEGEPARLHDLVARAPATVLVLVRHFG
jgi:hypothetical protein